MYIPVLVIHNVGALLSNDKGEGKDILYLLQDFAKTIADERILTVVFAASDGQVFSLFFARSAGSRLYVPTVIGDISHQQALEYLNCMCPDHVSTDAINQTVDLVGGRFVHLQMAAVILARFSDFSLIRNELFTTVIF